MTSFHVVIRRTADTSTAHTQMGCLSQVGRVTVSRTFHEEPAAHREADAWRHTGDFLPHGPSDWAAEIRPGPAPAAPCGVKVCTVMVGHSHGFEHAAEI